MSDSIAAAPATPSSRHIRSLDGLRGAAFLLVFVRHYSLSSHITTPLVQWLQRWGQGGWVGVDLFFALSGFLITGILLDTAGLPHYFRNFIARRALRIFPLYYGVFLLLGLLTSVLHLRWSPGHLLYLLYLGNFAQCIHPHLSQVPPAVSLLHLWSLAVEEQFYLIWPGVIYLLARRRRDLLLPVCLGLSALSFALRLTLVILLPRAPAYEWVYAMLPTHMDGLLFGAVAAFAIRTWAMERILPIARRALVSAALALAAIYAVSGPDFYSLPMTLAGYPILAVLFSSIILLALPERSILSRIGSLPLLRFFGRYSYGMYIVHMLFNPLTAPLLGWSQRRLHSPLLGGFAYVAEVLAATTVLSVLSFHLYERRWLRLKDHFSNRPGSPAQAVAS